MTRPEPCFTTEPCPDCGGIGQDDNAHFFCWSCGGDGTIPAHLYCYEVTSPEIDHYIYGEPPDPGVCWGKYVAPNKRQAIIKAVKAPEFKDWVEIARGDQVPPFKGLEVKLTRCEHGICWGCQATETSSGCKECDKCTTCNDTGQEYSPLTERYEPCPDCTKWA